MELIEIEDENGNFTGTIIEKERIWKIKDLI